MAIENPVSDERQSLASEQFPVSARIRWLVAGLLFLAAVLNYIDRNVLSILAPTIQEELGISDAGYADILNAFLVAYTIAYFLSGRVVDRLGSKISFALFVGWWSLANCMAALSRGAASMGAFRALLGLGEAGGWTVSPKVVQDIFPPSQRATVIGIYSMGSSIGATVAPLLVIPIALHYSWHWAFVITGGLGFLWVGLWLFVHQWIPQSAPAPRSSVSESGSEWKLWKSVLGQKAVWIFMAARMLTDSVWYFYLFWMPKYLHVERGLSQKELTIMWVIFLAADIGFIGGGFLSGRFIKCGVTTSKARLLVMLGTALIAPLSLGVAFVHSSALAIGFASLIALGHASWLSNLSALILDIVPKRIMATTFGVIAGGSALGGIMMNSAVSRMVDQFSYTPCFIIMALLHPIAFVVLFSFRKSMQTLSAEKERD